MLKTGLCFLASVQNDFDAIIAYDDDDNNSDNNNDEERLLRSSRIYAKVASRFRIRNFSLDFNFCK